MRGSLPDLFKSIRNGDRSAIDAYKARENEIFDIGIRASLAEMTAEDFFAAMQAAAEERTYRSVRIFFRHDNCGNTEIVERINEFAEPYVEAEAIGLWMLARMDDQEGWISFSLFHYTETPREHLISLDQVGELLTEYGYKRTSDPDA